MDVRDWRQGVEWRDDIIRKSLNLPESNNPLEIDSAPDEIMGDAAEIETPGMTW